MDAAREKLDKAEAQFEEAKRAGNEVSDDLLQEIEKAHKEVSGTLSKWWDDIKARVDNDKRRDLSRSR